jgi:hypothetical protein
MPKNDAIDDKFRLHHSMLNIRYGPDKKVGPCQGSPELPVRCFISFSLVCPHLVKNDWLVIAQMVNIVA